MNYDDLEKEIIHNYSCKYKFNGISSITELIDRVPDEKFKYLIIEQLLRTDTTPRGKKEEKAIDYLSSINVSEDFLLNLTHKRFFQSQKTYAGIFLNPAMKNDSIQLILKVKSDYKNLIPIMYALIEKKYFSNEELKKLIDDATNYVQNKYIYLSSIIKNNINNPEIIDYLLNHPKKNSSAQRIKLNEEIHIKYKLFKTEFDKKNINLNEDLDNYLDNYLDELDIDL